MKPTRYFVEYTSEEAYQAELARHGGDSAFADPARYRKDRSAETLEAARKLGAELQEAVIYERKNIRDDTPQGDPPGLLWDWDTEFLEEGASLTP